MTGVFISKGIKVGIPVGGLQMSIDPSGNLQCGKIQLQVHFDVVPSWTTLALKHLADTQNDKLARHKAWSAAVEEDKGLTLEREFQSSMQAIMSAAIALDAFYAALQDKIKIDQELRDKWRANRTARYAQIAEVIRMAFQLKPKGSALLRNNLKEIYRLRDLAVHPSATLKDPILHPELGVGVEWRFFYFRFDHALLVVRSAVETIHELVAQGVAANEAIKEYSATLKPQFDIFSDANVLKQVSATP
jgi:hypothetical protein